MVFFWLPLLPAQDFALLKEFHLGGEGRWDYLTYDADAHRLFIARESHVMVADAANGKLLADIPDTPGVHGVALAPDLGKGFISAGKGNEVIVFDLKTLHVTAKVPASDVPDAIAYEPVTHRVFTFNAHSQDSTVIDAKTDKVVGTIPLQGKPEFAVHDGAGHIYVNIETSAEIAEIDAATLKVLHRWPLAGCEEPTGLAIDVAHGVLFSGCSNQVLIVFDAKAGKSLAKLPIGDRVDGVAFDPSRKLAFSSNGEGTLTIIGGDSAKGFRVAQTAKTRRGARTLALDPQRHIIYVVTAEYEPVAAGSNARPTPKPGTFTLLMVAEE